MPAWDYSQLPATIDGATPFRLNATGSPDGGPCFQAGAIPHNGRSLARFVAPSAGVFTIGYQVSSEGNYDFLTAKAQFSANHLFRVSGQTPWATATVHVAAGEALDVTYTKDGSTVRGSDTGWITLAFVSDTFAIQGRTTLMLAVQGALSGATTAQMLRGQAGLRLTLTGLLNPRKAIKAKAALRLIARHGSAQPPSGLGMQMNILTDPTRPAVIRDQSLLVWFNGHPAQCRIALQLDDSAAFEPAFTWQNPGSTHPAIIKIASAAIPGDGFNHQLAVTIQQRVGQRTSPTASTSQLLKIPTLRTTAQPEWCGATLIRQAQVFEKDANNPTARNISDLTRIDWRHSGAVQIMARIPDRNSASQLIQADLILGYADHTETTFYAENLPLRYTGNVVHNVLFGVAAIQNGTFGPVTWANAPIRIHWRGEINIPPAKTPDEIAGTAKVHTLYAIQEDAAKALFSANGWNYAYTTDYAHPDERLKNQAIKTTIEKLLLRIKHILRQGGSVILDDLGRFEARWNPERTVRSVGFVASQGFSDGTKAGYVLTDQQAKAINP